MYRRAALVLFGLVFCSICFAGEPITIGESFTIDSKVLGEERTVLVSTPAGYDQSQESYIVVYMTDGPAHLTYTRGIADVLARNGLAPNLIIVGVANTDRTRDLTPTRTDYPRRDGGVVQAPTSGGAADFLTFFEKELIPFINSRYRTLPYRIFSGHSFGGLFAVNALVTRPELFDAVIALSPSLRWDDDFPIRMTEDFFEDRKKFKATLFVAMGNEEEGDPRPNRLDRLEAALQAADVDGLRWRVVRHPDENHGSVVLRAQDEALRFVFEGWLLPVDPETRRFVGGLDEFKKHYAGQSDRFGFTVQPSEQMVNLLGYQMLGQGQFDEAIEIFRYNVTLYPTSANVYDSLGEAFERTDRLDEAAANYSKAVENATALGDVRLPIFTENRDRAKAALEHENAN